MTHADLINLASSALGFENAEPLAQGGQKFVLKGTLSGSPAVAKVVLLGTGPNRDVTLQRAHREVELLSAVDSDHVVKVLTDAIELGDGPDAVCWAEEYLDGCDLTALLNNSWNEESVRHLLHDMAIALSACHELEVVHRDLSPANVRRTSRGRFVLMDPGLARHLARTALTGNFQPGTLGWRSPEHVPGGDPTPASDIFCLGILGYYALTGQFPIDPCAEPADYDRSLRESRIPSVREVCGHVSGEFADVIDRCLSRQPARRYLDGAELESDLRRLEE